MVKIHHIKFYFFALSVNYYFELPLLASYCGLLSFQPILDFMRDKMLELQLHYLQILCYVLMHFLWEQCHLAFFSEYHFVDKTVPQIQC